MVYIYEGEYKVSNKKKARPAWIQAPESFRNGLYRTESDMFMFGILLWEFLNYENMTIEDMKFDLDDYQYDLKSGRSQKKLLTFVRSKAARDLIGRCLSFEYFERPSASEALSDLDHVFESVLDVNASSESEEDKKSSESEEDKKSSESKEDKKSSEESNSNEDNDEKEPDCSGKNCEDVGQPKQ